jgi:hypothetical protein
MKLLIFLLIFSTSAMARVDVWSEGMHLYVGGGANSSLYDAKGYTLGEGLHFKTDFGYSFKKAWAIEAGSFVKFTKVHDTLIWDTLLTIGVRRKIGDDHFIRVFAGQAPTVFFTKDLPEVYRRSKATRILYTGPVFGVSFGKIYEDWFWEVTGSYQTLDKSRGIKNVHDVPEEVFRTDNNGVRITSLAITFGIQVF